MTKRFKSLALLLLVAFILAACSTSAFPDAQDVPDQSDTVEVDTPPEAAEPTATAEQANEAAVEPTAAVVANEEPTALPTATEAPMVTVRQELEATNPATFSIASGEVQLVEFFAFW